MRFRVPVTSRPRRRLGLVSAESATSRPRRRRDLSPRNIQALLLSQVRWATWPRSGWSSSRGSRRVFFSGAARQHGAFSDRERPARATRSSTPARRNLGDPKWVRCRGAWFPHRREQLYHGWHPVSVERHGIVHSASRYLRRDRIYASQPPRLVSTECPRRSRGVATTRLRNIHAARIHPVVHHAVFVGLEHPPLLATGTAHVPATATGLCVIHTSRRSASWARPVLAEYPRRGRGGGATRPHGISTSWPRRRRDPSPRNIHVVAAAAARLVCGYHSARDAWSFLACLPRVSEAEGVI